ncbi:MAG: Putative transposase [uncultured Thermomicrobiales bacterium]|uniref:Transposase n=1 Tax=uncultured Thermomicrobiales bacterium TaxID=1645740 RepID=A0A6J4U9Y6_9BACT|nr:MAG: Putative transposase [uncultured Thermomicrobiales bacterium]
MIGLELDDVAVDGCITKAPGGGEAAGRSPVDRGKQGLKRSTVTDATGIPFHVVATGANRHDEPLLGPTLAGLEAWVPPRDRTTVHLDRGYDSGVTRALLDALGFIGAIARKGLPAPVQVGKRWVVERTHAWMNGYGKLRRCTEKAKSVVDFYLSRSHVRRHALPDPAGAIALPVAGTPYHAEAEMMPIAGRSK